MLGDCIGLPCIPVSNGHLDEQGFTADVRECIALLKTTLVVFLLFFFVCVCHLFTGENFCDIPFAFLSENRYVLNGKN